MRTVSLLFILAACAPAVVAPDLRRDEAPVAPAGDDVADRALSAQEHRARALTAYQNKDWATVQAEVEAALAADPESLTDRYNLACAYALNGNKEGALAQLALLLEVGVDYGAAMDPDFASLQGDPEFQKLLEAFATLTPKVTTSTQVLTVGERQDLAADGMAYDAATGRFFVSSMRTGEILAMGADGATESFAELETDGVPLSAFGLAVDAARGTLWAVGAAFSLHEDFDVAHQGTTKLFALDLQTGEVTGQWGVAGKHPSVGFNDVAVVSDGSVYVSGGDLLVLRPGAEQLVPVGLNPPLRTSNGLAVTEDGTLYVAANRKGIARVNTTTGAWAFLGAPPGVDLRAFSGLYAVDGGLAGIQLGLGRWRASRITLDGQGTAVTGLQVLEQGNPDIAFATSGAVVDGTLYYVARSPLPPGTDRAAVGPAGGATVIWKAPL